MRAPVLGALLLTLGAVAIAARVITVVERAAIVTAVEGAAECRGAAADDVVHGAAMRGQHPCRVDLTVARPRGAEDVRQLQRLRHGAKAVDRS